MSTETKVGIFALIIIVILSLMTFKVGGLGWIKKEGYEVYVNFKDVSGLDTKSRVKIAGVEAGYIDSIKLVGGYAKLTLRIYPHIVLYSDACASIKSQGLLGERYLELTVGSKPPVLKNDNYIQCVQETTDLDALMRKFGDLSKSFTNLTENLNSVLAPEQREELRETIASIRDLSRNLNSAVSANDTRLRTVLDGVNTLVDRVDRIVERNEANTDELVANLRDLSATLKTEVPGILANINGTSAQVKDMVANASPAIQNIVTNTNTITTRLEEGKGTLGKLLTDEHLYVGLNNAVTSINQTFGAINRFKTYLTFEGQFLSAPKSLKGEFYLTLQPEPDKYYILGVVSDPIQTVSTQTVTINGQPVTEQFEQRKITFTAQYARRWYDFAIRAGLVQNTFGFGGDYFFYKDRLKLSADVWDFQSDEQGNKHPHFTTGLDYFIFKNIFLQVGGDDLLNKSFRSVYVGAGMKFEDEDLKYLLGAVPRL